MSSTDRDDGTVRTDRDDRTARTDPDDRTAPTRTDRRDDDSDGDYLLGLSLGGLLLVAGVLLFLFPEPATSTVGIGLAIVGAVLLVADAVRSS